MICLCVDFFIAFEYAPFGYDFYFYSENGKLSYLKVYVSLSSPIASSEIGSVVAIVIFVIKDGVTLFLAVTINLTSYIQMRKYYSKRHFLIPTIQIPAAVGIQHLPGIATNNQRNERQRVYEKNIMWMVIIVCLNSCIVKTTTFFCNIYWLFEYDLIANILGIAADTFIAMNSMLPFLIYLRFNRKFREILLKKLFKKGGLQGSSVIS